MAGLPYIFTPRRLRQAGWRKIKIDHFQEYLEETNQAPGAVMILEQLKADDLID